MPEPLPFARWLKRLRVDLDLTQEELAGAAGRAAQTIRTYESGTRRPSREMAERLADVLHVPPEQRVDFVRAARMPASPTPNHPDAAEQDRSPGGETRIQKTGLTTSGRPDSGHEATTSRTALEHMPILATKLYLPRPRAALVSRPRLLARLEAGLGGLLTLITAPAGFGKTTVLADWFNQLGARERKVAWLALDAGDSDPLRFLRYLVAALQTISPAIGGTTLNLLRAAQAPPLETLLPFLINDLVALPERSILVLDDYHVIDAPAVHEALAFLVERLPPHLHLVIASRVDPLLPLARLRARGQLTELRAHDLRFTPEEVAIFLREMMDLPLTVEDVAALEARTEGWIVGLQLAALSLRDRSREQQAEFVEAFTGSHRFVVDYLVDEVLTHLPQHLQTFMLQTSILGRLCGPLCDAVMLGEANQAFAAGGMGVQAYSQALLEELERSNLFIVPLDDARHWYRYHHLFAQVLRERLTNGARQGVVATLHRRASAWFEQQRLIAEAMQHALAGQDWERAAGLLAEHGHSLLQRGETHTVLGWLNALPETAGRAHPYLLLLEAIGLFFANKLEDAERRAQEAVEQLSGTTVDERSRTIQAYAISLRASVARFGGDFTRCISLSQQAMEIMPSTDVRGRTATTVNMASALRLSGDVSEANERRLLEAIPRVRVTSDLMTLFNAIITLADLQCRQGRLRQALATYREAAQVAPEPIGLQVLVNGAAYYVGLGNLLREWNDLDDAEQQLAQGLEMVHRGLLMEADVVVGGYSGLARLYQARGKGDDAIATLHELEKLARARNFPARLIAVGAAARAHLALLQSNLDTAVEWADMSDLCADDDLSYPREPEYITLARVRIAQGRCDRAGPYLCDALRLLDRLLEVAEADGRMHSSIDILILRALALQAQSNLPDALAALARVVLHAAPEGYVRVFVDEGAPMGALLEQALKETGWGLDAKSQDHNVRGYVHSLLAALRTERIEAPATLHLSPAPAQTSIPGVEPLTEREVEVLQLLAAGHSNKVIAQRLIVTVGTVKRHVNSILGKLAVQSRLQAVARARELGLV